MEILIVCILMEISSGAQSSGRFLELVAAKENHNLCHHLYHHKQFDHPHPHPPHNFCLTQMTSLYLI